MEINSKLIKQRMLDKGISLTELTNLMGIDKAYVWRLINGKAKKPTAYRLMQLATILDVDMKKLFI